MKDMQARILLEKDRKQQIINTIKKAKVNEGIVLKNTTKGKVKALGRVLIDPSKSYKAEKKKERKKEYKKGKKKPSEYETVKYAQKQPRGSTTPQR